MVTIIYTSSHQVPNIKLVPYLVFLLALFPHIPNKSNCTLRLYSNIVFGNNVYWRILLLALFHLLTLYHFIHAIVWNCFPTSLVHVHSSDFGYGKVCISIYIYMHLYMYNFYLLCIYVICSRALNQYTQQSKVDFDD